MLVLFWNGDGEFTSNDLVLAIQTGAYEHGYSGSAPVVPEPTTASLAMLAMVLALVRNRGRRQS